MEAIKVNQDDVISVLDKDTSPVGLTFKVSQVLNFFKQRLSSSPKWLEEGVECELLKTESSTGWQKGKVVLRIEFIPDNPES